MRRLHAWQWHQPLVVIHSTVINDIVNVDIVNDKCEYRLSTVLIVNDNVSSNSRSVASLLGKNSCKPNHVIVNEVCWHCNGSHCQQRHEAHSTEQPRNPVKGNNVDEETILKIGNLLRGGTAFAAPHVGHIQRSNKLKTLLELGLGKKKWAGLTVLIWSFKGAESESDTAWQMSMTLAMAGVQLEAMSQPGHWLLIILN